MIRNLCAPTFLYIPYDIFTLLTHVLFKKISRGHRTKRKMHPINIDNDFQFFKRLLVILSSWSLSFGRDL